MAFSTASDCTIIEASKTKTLFVIAVSLGCVAMGTWILSLEPAEIESARRYNSPFFVYTIGIALVGLFGLGSLVGVWRLFSEKPGIILNQNGIEIFVVGSSTLVSWTDISGFSVIEINSQKMLVIELHDPKKYIETGGIYRRLWASVGYKMYGGPISISAGALKTTFEELCDLCETYFQRYAAGA